MQLEQIMERANQFSTSPLVLATKLNLEHIVKLLLESGSNVDEQDNNGLTSLMIACENKSLKIAKLLIKFHTNINKRNNYGKLH